MSTAKQIIANVAGKVLSALHTKKESKSKKAKGMPHDEAEETAPKKASSNKKNAAGEKAGKAKKQTTDTAEQTTPAHGKDQHFIPQHGVSNAIKTKEKTKTEKAFKHHEETALHQEQQRVKNAMTTHNKRIYQHPRQS